MLMKHTLQSTGLRLTDSAASQARSMQHVRCSSLRAVLAEMLKDQPQLATKKNYLKKYLIFLTSCLKWNL